VGLITGLLTLPLAPVRGVAWVAERVAEEAQRELYDEGRIIQELIELEMALDRGEIRQEAFDAHVEALLQRLEVAHQLAGGS